MSSKNSVKLYNYEEINNLSVTEKHFSITDKNSKKSIIFTSKEVSQMKGNFEKGYFIIEGKMAEIQTYLKTAELQKIKDLDREICIIWNHSGKVREYRFTGRCVCYTEHFSKNNQNYFEIVLQETTAVSEYNRFIKINDYYAFVEITPNTMKAIPNRMLFGQKVELFWEQLRY